MTEDELDLQRGRYPLGAHITGRVSHIPRPGAIGLFVDLGEPPGGFVDVLNLPYAADEWPTVGTEATFEVVQHRVGQVRLWPLDPELRTTDPVGRSTEQLHARYPVGSDITGVVTEVFPSNREYWVEFGDDGAAVEWTGVAPEIGDVRRFRVSRHLMSPRALLLEQV